MPFAGDNGQILPPKEPNPLDIPQVNTAQPDRQPGTSSDNKKLIVQRSLQYKQPDFWQNFPEATVRLMTSQIPEQHHEVLAGYTPQMADWISRRESFGGVNGALIKVRLKALAIPDPDLRARELAAINDIAKLSPGDQAMFMAYANDPAAFAGTSFLEGRVTGEQNIGTGAYNQADASAPQTGVMQILGGGGQIDPATGQITVSAEDVSLSQVETLERLFPSLVGKVHFDDGRGITLDDWRESTLERATALATPIATPILKHGVTPLSVGQAAVGTVFEAGTTPFQGIGSAINLAEDPLSAGAHRAGFGGQVDSLINEWEGIAGAGYRRFNYAMATTANTLGRFALEGRIPGTNIILRKGITQATGRTYVPPSEESVDFAGQLILAASLHGASEAAGTITKGLSGPAEGTAAALGVEGEAGLRGTFEGASALDIAKHPFREGISPIVTKAAWDVLQDVHATGWADWVQRSQAGKVFDFVARHSMEADGVAKVQERYPMLPEDYVRRLVDTAREDMPQATLDYADDVAKSGEAKTLRAQQSSAQAKINTAQRAHDEAFQAWDDAGKPVSRPSGEVDPAAIDQLGRTLDANLSGVEDREASFTDIGFLEESDAARMTRNLQRRIAAGDASVEDMGNGVYRQVPKGAEDGRYTYYATDSEGNVVSVRNQYADGAATAETLENSSGQGHAKKLILQAWEDAGITDLSDPAQVAKLQEFLQNGEFSHGGIALNKSAIRTLLGDSEELNAVRQAGDTLQKAKLDKIALDEKVAEAAMAPSPVLRFPGRATLPDFLHRVLYRPSSLAERAFRIVLSPREASRWISGVTFAEDGAWLTTSKVPAIAKLVDKLAADAKLSFIEPSMSGVEREFLQDQNLTILNRMLSKLGVPEGAQAAIKQALMDAKTQDEWWHVVTNDLFGSKGVINRYLPDNIPAEFREKIIGTGGGDPLDYNHSVEVNGHSEPILPGEEVQGTPTPLPSAPSEFQNRVGIPSPKAIEDAMSGARRWAKNAKDAAEAHDAKIKAITEGTLDEKLPSELRSARVRTEQAGAYVLDFSRAALHLTTAGLKVPALLFNLPAIVLTKVLDESLGNANTPGISRVIRTPAEAVDYYMRIEPDALGSTISGFFGDGAPGARSVGEVSAAKVLSKGGDQQVFASIIDRLNQIHDDPMLSKFAQILHQGGGIEEMKALLTGGDESLTRFFDEQVAPQLARAGMDVDTWLGRWSDSIKQATLDDPRWMEYAAHGRIRGAAHSVTLENGTDAAASYTRVKGDIGAIQKALKDLNPLHKEDVPMIRRLQEVLKNKYSELEHIERTAAERGLDVKESGVIRADRQHPGAATAELRRQFDGNEIKLPDRVRVETKRTSLSPEVKNIPEIMEGWAQKFSNDMYSRSGKFSFQAIGRAEAKTARGNYYTQAYDRFTKEGLGHGLSLEDAKTQAHFRALEQTRDLFYDLTARSSMERSVRNVFWFAPVNAELLYRWLYAIPAQSGGLLPGAALLVAKAANYENLLRDHGIIQKDPETGDDVIPIPGLSNLISGMTGGGFRIPDTATVSVKSLSPHLSGPIPELSPIPAKALNTAAQYIPALRGLAAVVAPYSDVTVVPTSIRNTLALAGVKLPDLSNDYVGQQWDRTQDQAYQLAFVSLQREGDTAPTLADFHLDPAEDGYALSKENQDAYEKAWGEWFDRLSTRQSEYARGAYALKLVSGALIPGSIQTSDPAQVEFENFWRNSILPQLQPGQPMPDTVRATLDKWLADNPESLAFSISYNAYTGKTWQPDHVSTDGTDYTQLYLHHVKATLPPEEYGPVLAALTSRATYTSRARAEIDAISPDGDPAEVLRNWGDRSSAMNNSAIAWENYLITHPDADALIKLHQAYMDRQYGTAPDSIEAHYVKDSLLSLKALADHFTGEGGLTDQEYQSVMGDLKAQNAKLYEATGGDLTPMEKGISYYFDNVLTPYMDATQPLYTQAAKLQAQGKDTSAIYDQIAKIKSQYSDPTYNGESYPSPDEFFYGSKTPEQQKLTKLNWITKPVAWLSPFQRETAGYQSFEGEDEMFRRADEIRQQVSAIVDSGEVSPGSKQYDALQKWSLQSQNAIAAEYGKEGKAAMALNLEDPYVRLEQSGYGVGNESMQNVYAMVGQVHDILAQQNLSTGGYSSDAIALKQWVYGYIVQQESADPEFRALMDKLHLAQTPLPSGMHPAGVPMWEAVFFGNYNPAYIPNQLINSVPNGVV